MLWNLLLSANILPTNITHEALQVGGQVKISASLTVPLGAAGGP
jgi:hypothetical protein